MTSTLERSGLRPVAFVVVAAVCFGTTGTAQELGPDEATSSAVGLSRIVVGGLLLGLAAWWAARRPGARLPRIGWSQRGTVLVAGAAVLAYQPMFFAGTRLNGVAVGAVVTLGAAPVLTGLLEWVLTRRVPSRAWFAGTGAAVVGVVLIGGLVDGGARQVSLAGLAGSAGAALAYAVYTLAVKRLLTDGWGATVAIGGVFATAAVMGAPLLLLVDLAWLGSAPGVGLVVWLAVVTVVVAYVLFATGLRALPASTVSTLTLVEPLTACVLGVAVLGERLSTQGWVGLAVLLGGVTVLAVRR
ncbi:DMT family transporter [Aeromicrobium endophyticum]|uniref:EamA family transporter n=1 Tax=Aeromicrobium endophyticum TaxID=2292704 RepID=A0A371NYP8_9ACTN|nr:EamA family transporter [Aeromicrobium endophyticum]REK68813.1 EamA family transporter [Aeromicrobium endophyticum]